MKTVDEILKERDSLAGAIESLIRAFEESNGITVKTIKIESQGIDLEVKVSLSNIFEQ
jgi:ABC-type glycerol-3-phosphate transport system substrate-binding protein